MAALLDDSLVIVLAGGAELVRAAPGLAIAGLVATRVAKVDQRVEVAVGHGIDAAALAAVATIGSAEWTKFFTTKRCNAVATIARNNFDFCFVYKLHDLPPKNKKALPAAEPFCRRSNSFTLERPSQTDALLRP